MKGDWYTPDDKRERWLRIEFAGWAFLIVVALVMIVAGMF